ncbi:MAG: hypothetical protein QG607_603 [Patescibacteria group bacterium]|jgi:hypothetical protein|nr:hypothetical protein [Patescibacteria group bacterium]
METKNIIRNVYLYLVSAVTLFMLMFAFVSLVNLGLRTWVFPMADETSYYIKQPAEYCIPDKDGKQTCPSAEERAKLEAQDKERQSEEQKRQRQRELVQNFSMIIVAGPLFVYHWLVIKKDRKEA